METSINKIYKLAKQGSIPEEILQDIFNKVLMIIIMTFHMK